MFVIKKATRKEICDIQTIAQITWRKTYLDIIPSEQLEFMLNYFYNEQKLSDEINNDINYDIISDNNIKMGFISYTIENCLSLKVNKIYILPDHQEKGLGRILINKTLDFAKELGLNKIILNVNRNNKAINFYKHLGFTIAYEQDVPIPNGYFMYDYVMIKEL